MELFAGLETTDCQDLFRAIGALIDEQALRDVRLWEYQDGIIIQARREEAGGLGPYQTYRPTDDDLQNLLNLAYKRRGMPIRRIMMGA